MDDTERGSLLLQQEKLTKSIADMRAVLKKHGNTLAEFANALQKDPERIAFANAPELHAATPLGPTTMLNWDAIPEKASLSGMVHQLRDDISKLAGVKVRLDKPDDEVHPSG